MPRKQLIDKVLILFTAGHETSANALSFTLLLLAKHTHIQEKLFKEVDSIDFDNNDHISQLGKLRYAKQCIEESMRLFPPAYFFDRASLGNDTLNGYAYKKNTVWLMNIYELHRHPDYWEDANKFMPERFDPANKKDFSDYYFPFGAGPRMCIGNNFAMFEMIFTVALIIKKYRIQTEAEQVEINPLITLKPKEVLLKFRDRYEIS